MKKVYVLKTNHDGLIGVYTNKKRVYSKMASMVENKKGLPSYGKFCKEMDSIFWFDEKPSTDEYWDSETTYTIDTYYLNH